MKFIPSRIRPALFVLAALVADTHAQSITDSFPGTSLNASNWIASLYDETSAVTVNNGLTLTNRGRIATAVDFTQPNLTITGSVSFSASSDSLWIAFRSDGTFAGQVGETGNGLVAAFGPSGGGVAISAQGPGSSTLLSGRPFSFSTGQTYNFKVTDNGSMTALFIDDFGSPLITATSVADGGDRVIFFNREVGAGAYLSSVSVTAVPGPSASASYLYRDVRYSDAVKTSATGISGNLVVGNYASPTGGANGEAGFVYDLTTKSFLADIPQAPDANLTVVMGIDGNDVVGYYFTAWSSPPSRGFIYNRSSGSWRTIDDGTDNGPIVFGKSGDWIIGSTGRPSGEAFLMNLSTDAYLELLAPGVDSTGVRFTGISGNKVVGDYNINGVKVGFVYTITAADGTGTWSDPFSHPAASGQGTQVNGTDGHKVVGQFNDNSGWHSYVYDLDAAPENAFSALEDFAGYITGAVGISNGVIVGYYVADIQATFLAMPVDGATSTSRLTVPFVDPFTNATLGQVRFTEVVTEGETSLAVGPAGPEAPAGFRLGDPATYYHLSTTAGLNPASPITVTFSLAGMTFPGETRVLYHFHDGGWEPVADATVDGNLISGTVYSLSPFAIFVRPYVAQVQPPIAANGSSVFAARRGVVNVKFNLTSDGHVVTKLPPATIAVFRATDEGPVLVPVSTYQMPSDNGASFRITGPKYSYEVGAGSLDAGSYEVKITIGGLVVGSASFRLK